MVWKIFGGVLLVPAGFVALVALTLEEEYKAGIEWPLVGLFCALSFLCFWRGAKADARKKEQLEKVTDVACMEDSELQQIEAGVLPSLAWVPVILGEGEVGHFCSPARRYITKRKAIGRTGGGGGISVRVAKGISLRSGGGASKTIYDDVTDSFDGLIILTNRRIVFIAKQNGFDCKLSSISAIVPEGNRILIQVRSNAYRLSVAKQGHFVRALGMVISK